MKKYIFPIVAITLSLLSISLLASEKFTVSVIKSSDVERKEIKYTGIIRYRNSIQIVTPVSGVLTDIQKDKKRPLAEKALLYKLERNAPGYPEIMIENSHVGKVINNTLYEVGDFIERDKTILTLVDPISYKVVINVLPYNMDAFQSSQAISVIIATSTDSFEIPVTDYKVHTPSEHEIHYRVEAFFDCTLLCKNKKLIGKAAIVKSKKSIHTNKIPTRLLVDGMTKVFILNEKGVVAKHTVKLREVDEVVAILDEPIEGRVISKYSQPLKAGMEPDEVIEE